MRKPGIFITGAPRSGTSMVTKVIDAHPGVAILMENIFENRRRHWTKADFWHSPETLRAEACKVFSKVHEPIIGNKVCTPDVWSAEDILFFCRLFLDFKIVFILRDPLDVALSRFKREDYSAEFNGEAKKNILLDFRSRFLTYTSSWRQSIENYWRLRDGYPENIYLIYYEDFCQEFETEARKLFQFLHLQFCDEILNWHTYPHHDRNGDLSRDLKYRDEPVTSEERLRHEIPTQTNQELEEALKTISTFCYLWKKRRI